MTKTRTDPLIRIVEPAEQLPTSKARAKYELTAPDRAAVTPATRRPITYDLVAATILVRSALPRVAPFRDAIVRHGGITAELFDRIGDLAIAAWYAHTVWLSAARPAAPLATLLAAAIDVRADLLLAARSAARKRQLDGSRLDVLASGRSALDVAQNLNALCIIVREAWPRLAGRTALEITDLTAAEKLAKDLFDAHMLREGTSPALTAAADERLRAATAFANPWDEVRRAMQFERWHHGDADEIAPSIYQRAAPRRNREASRAARTQGKSTRDGTPGSDPFGGGSGGDDNDDDDNT